jgi:hypothetical protein
MKGRLRRRRKIMTEGMDGKDGNNGTGEEGCKVSEGWDGKGMRWEIIG